VAETFQFSADVSSQPVVGFPSGDPTVDIPINFLGQIKRPLQQGAVFLTTDNPVSLSFGDLASAMIVVITTVGGKIRVRYTSTDGAQQAVPCDPIAVVVAQSVPMTAVDVTRVAGSGSTVQVNYALGEHP
jgi:hypothetical protein